MDLFPSLEGCRIAAGWVSSSDRLRTGLTLGDYKNRPYI